MITREQIKYIRSLQQKKHREEYRCFIAEGLKIIREVIASSRSDIEFLVCTSKYRKQLETDFSIHELKIIEASEKEFSRISNLKTPQEALAVLRMGKQANSTDSINKGLLLALDRIQDPGNFGTLLRIADWFGIKNLICSNDCVDIYNPKVIQASMGAFLRVRVRYGNLTELLPILKEKQGFTIYGTALNGDSIYTEDYADNSVIILGNESSGISRPVMTITDRQLVIPNYGAGKEKTESLNVSVAAAVICSEIRRRK